MEEGIRIMMKYDTTEKPGWQTGRSANRKGNKTAALLNESRGCGMTYEVKPSTHMFFQMFLLLKSSGKDSWGCEERAGSESSSAASKRDKTGIIFLIHSSVVAWPGFSFNQSLIVNVFYLKRDTQVFSMSP